MRKRLIFWTASALCLLPLLIFAYPDTSKNTLSLISSQANGFILSDDGRYLFVSTPSAVSRVDTQTWALTSTQVPTLDASEDSGADEAGNVKGLVLREGFLFASQNDGDLLKIDLSKITADPEAYVITSSDLGELAADPENGEEDDQIYIADQAGKQIKIFDISSHVVSSATLLDESNAAVTPGALAYLALPTGTGSGGTTDRLYIATDEGLLFVLSEGSTAATVIDIDSSNGDTLSDVVVSSDRQFIFVLNGTDQTVHVLDAVSGTELDTDADATNGTTPISISDNDDLNSLVVTDVASPSDTYAFVTGTNGVSVIDLNISGSTFQSGRQLDTNDAGTVEDTVNDPISISGTPGLILASAEPSERLFTANTDGSIALITENPIVTISASSILDAAAAATTTLGSGTTFTFTFQSDETGSYSVRLGGDTSANGIEMASGTVDTAGTALTTAQINYDTYASSFNEGTNRIFIFVTDGDSHVGWDAIDLTADTPPGGVTITSMGFGDGRLYLNFTPLSASDISSYNIYVDTDEATASSKTDALQTVSQPSGTDELTVALDSLTNNTLYYVAISAVDAAGNVGPRSTSSGTPEQTLGLTGALGETGGCSLILD